MSFIIALIAILCSAIIGEAMVKTVILVLSFIAYVMYAVGVYKIFEKANIKGWYAIVPILNDFELFKLSWNPTMYLPYVVLSIVVQYYKEQTKTSIFSIVFAIALFVVEIMFIDRLAKAFGKDNLGFKIGLFCFQPIFMLILGLGDAKYLGPQA